MVTEKPSLNRGSSETINNGGGESDSGESSGDSILIERTSSYQFRNRHAPRTRSSGNTSNTINRYSILQCNNFSWGLSTTTNNNNCNCILFKSHVLEGFLDFFRFRYVFILYILHCFIFYIDCNGYWKTIFLIEWLIKLLSLSDKEFRTSNIVDINHHNHDWDKNCFGTF